TFNIPLKKDQKFSENLSLVDAKSGKVDGAWELKDSGTELFLRYLEPERELILTITPKLTAENGKRLRKEYSKTIETRRITPSIGFASTGVLLPIRISEGLPVVTLNVNRVDVDFFRVRDKSIHNFLKNWNQARPLNVWDANHKLKEQADLVFTGRFDLNPKPNRRETQYLPVTDIRQLREPGAYFAVMRQAGNYQYYMPATFFTLSDIGVSLHSYSHSLSVFSQSLGTGKALPDVEFTLFDASGNTLATGKSDRNGYAVLPLQDNAKGLLAQKGKETTLLMLSTPALDLSEFSITGPAASPRQFFAFSPRDLYRPGEIVPLNALLRDMDGKLVPSQPVSVTVQQPDGKTASTFTWNSEKDSYYRYNLQLSSSAPTGRWRLLFDLGDGNPKHYEFLVEDFLPERMALEIKGNEGPLLKNDSIDFQVQGRYLYGAPASGNLLTSQVFVSFLREAVPALPGYQFGSVTERAPYNFVELSDVSLNEEGEAEISVDNQWGDIGSPIQLTYQASLQESGGRSVTRRLAQPLWPASTLPGIRGVFTTREKNAKGEAYIDSDSTVKFEVVLSDMKGKKLASEGLRVRMIRERRDYYWVYSDDDGWDYRYDEKFLTLFDERVPTEEDGIGEISFPVDWGPYRVEVEDPETGLVSSLRFWAGYSWQDNTKAGAVRPDQVKMVLDRPAYKAGDSVSVTLTPPAAGSGYLMVESSDGPLWWQAIQVPSEGKAFEFPIPAEWARHDLYVSALVIRPGDKKAFQTPKRAVGLLHLPLDRNDRKIDLAIKAPERMRPNEPLTIQVQAKDVQGRIPKDAQVVISAVDVGVLNITNFKTPDPHANFFSRKAYGADQLDIYGNIIEAGKGSRARLAFGGDAPEMTPGGKKPDTTVLIVALQSDALSFDENGIAEVSLDIPDFNGTLRLMAQAWNGEQYGMAEAKTLVAAPLVMEISMPRFLAGGDETTLALDLTNLSGKDQAITLNFKTEGALRLKNEPAGEPIALKQGERKTLTFTAMAAGGLAVGRIRASVTGLDLPHGEKTSFERNWQLGIRPAYPIEIQQFRAVLKPGESWEAPPGLVSSYFAEGREALAKVSGTPPLNIARQIQELKAYPYGCLEQTTSGIYPFLYVNETILGSLGIKGESDEERRSKIDIGIARLLDKQRYNGSFGMWSRDSEESFWLTVYATDFLLRAREQGFSVSENALKNATNRLIYYLNNRQGINPDYSTNTNHLRFAVQAYAAYVLARSNQAPLGALRTIYERKGDARSGLSLVQLGIAMSRMGALDQGNELIAMGVNFKEEAYSWYGDYGSKIRNDAMIYALLSEHNLGKDERDKLIFRLSDQVMDQRYLSTQERNAVFLAGRFLLTHPESDWTADLLVGSDHSSLTGAVPSLRLLDEKVVLPIKITNRSEETLYSEFSFAAYPKEAPAPVMQQIEISREFFSIDGSNLNLSNLKSGDLVLVHLSIRAKRRISDALVVDFLPAGLELENQNLQNASVSLKDAGARVQEYQRDMERGRILHQEYRGDRYVAAVDLQGYGTSHLLYLARAVTPGRYLIPPPTVHSMYRPEWQAVGETPKYLVVSPK
ncbi:alpha-2-macroglobulin family protein, partial [Desulfococcaceae bacterium OttesenSCG-928-F15]|nr:alpha-2-macroglobulin family protein [Desulfococcaceae bacterium OttesenSCG-928-F15]